jgi:hypothetical protein
MSAPDRHTKVSMERYAAPSIEPPRVFQLKIPSGFGGTQETASRMCALIVEGAKDFYVRQKAIDILLAARVPAKDYLGEIRALFEWVRDRVRYTRDPFRVEVLHSARKLAELRAGDCDDKTILLGAMLESVGHPVRLVLTGPDPRRPRLFSHVYLEVSHRGRWIPLDATMSKPAGWAPVMPTKMVVPLERRSSMPSVAQTLGAAGPVAVPEWLSGLMRAVAQEPVKPKDARVQQLWELLRRRRLLNRDPWVKQVLRRTWTKGLRARKRPRVTQRLTATFQAWGILPPVPAVATTVTNATTTAHTPGRQALPVAPLRLRPLRPVVVRKVGRVRAVGGRRRRGRGRHGLR